MRSEGGRARIRELTDRRRNYLRQDRLSLSEGPPEGEARRGQPQGRRETGSEGDRVSNVGVTDSLRTARLMFPAAPEAVPWVRRYVRAVLYGWELGHVADTAELLTCELVSNALRTVGTPAAGGVAPVVQVRLVMAGGRLFLGVRDGDRRPPVLGEADPDAEGGRGLLLVEALSVGWGHVLLPGGKVVWCALDVSVPRTAAGLPRRVPAGLIPAQEPPDVIDVDLLRRVVAGLRALPGARDDARRRSESWAAGRSGSCARPAVWGWSR